MRQSGLYLFQLRLQTTLKEQKDKVNGTVVEALPDTNFRVQLEDGRIILAYLAGKMRLHYIKVMIGDRVIVELSPDGARGRITYRS
jgi:translation initiation factor IF-1